LDTKKLNKNLLKCFANNINFRLHKIGDDLYIIYKFLSSIFKHLFDTKKMVIFI